MRKFLFFLLSSLFCAGLVNGQTGEKHMLLPKKFELPTIETTTESSQERTNDPWRVYTDRDNVLVYATHFMDQVVDTLQFLEAFVVWEETDVAVRLVSAPDSGVFLVDGYFGEGSRNCGWVKKDNLILWPQVLSNEGTTIKVLFSKNTNATTYADGRHSNAVVIPEKGFKLFNLLKVENKNFLLCKTDLVHKDLSKEDLFWIQSENLNVIWDRKVLVPDWEKLSRGQVLRVYGGVEQAMEDLQQNALDTFPSVNPYLGFFGLQAEKDNIYSAQMYLNQQKNKVFINNLHNDFKVAQLVDYNQFLIFKEFYQIFVQSPLKEELEENLVRFFQQRGIVETDINGKNIRELLEMVSGLKLSPMQSNEVVRVKDMKETDFRFDYLIFGTTHEKLSTEKDLEPYRFYSDILYFWLPETWLRPDLLSGIKLHSSDIKVKVLRTRQVYSEFDLIYIDNSSSAEEKSFEQLQAEISRCDIIFTRSQRNAASDIEAGHIFFYSNNINPILGKEEATLNNIILEMRSDQTSRPIRYYDKSLLENRLLINDIEQVKKTLNIHFIVSDNLLEEEINERALLFNEFPQRIKALIAVNAAVNVYLYVYEGKSNKDQMVALINGFIQKQAPLNPDVKYSVYKYN